MTEKKTAAKPADFVAEDKKNADEAAKAAKEAQKSADLREQVLEKSDASGDLNDPSNPVFRDAAANDETDKATTIPGASVTGATTPTSSALTHQEQAAGKTYDDYSDSELAAEAKKRGLKKQTARDAYITELRQNDQGTADDPKIQAGNDVKLKKVDETDLYTVFEVPEGVRDYVELGGLINGDWREIALYNGVSNQRYDLRPGQLIRIEKAPLPEAREEAPQLSDADIKKLNQKRDSERGFLPQSTS